MTKIAIVEDNAMLRKYLAELIDKTPGYRCVSLCGSAEEAIAEIPAQKPNVVLMDIHLPGESGIACTNVRTEASAPGSFGAIDCATRRRSTHRSASFHNRARSGR